MRIYDFSDYKNVAFIGNFNGNVDLIKDAISGIFDSVIICTGDLYIGKIEFNDDVERIASLQYILHSNNCKFVIIRGNHDNPKYFKRRSSFISEMKEIAEDVYLAQDYSVIQLEDKNILCIGGARSIDRFLTIKKIDYWQNEDIQTPPMDFYEELNNNDIKVDIIVSHSAPLFAKPDEYSKKLKYYNSYLMNACAMYDPSLKNDVYLERLLLKGIYEKLNNKHHIKYYIYGHFNKSIESVYNKTNMVSLNSKDIKII